MCGLGGNIITLVLFSSIKGTLMEKIVGPEYFSGVSPEEKFRVLSMPKHSRHGGIYLATLSCGFEDTHFCTLGRIGTTHLPAFPKNADNRTAGGITNALMMGPLPHLKRPGSLKERAPPNSLLFDVP